MTEIEKLEQAIAALEAQRSILGDAVVETALAPLRDKLAAFKSQSQPAASQRKQVTVLFADVSSFTALSESMDAEDVGATMNALWRRLDAVVLAHGGKIDKHIGDAVMALWGAEMAQEDDPEQAIRAALVMQQEIRDWRLEVQRTIAVQSLASSIANVGIRIGINTGPVLLGTVGMTGEYSALGDTVNLASRLEAAAPVGGLLISHDTYRHVRGIFNVQPLEPLVVRGKTDPVQVYLINSLKPRAFRVSSRGVESIETRMVGRDAELKHLQDNVYEVLDQPRTHVVTVAGEAGVGKSRLLYEFNNWIELLPDRLWYFKGRATLQMASVPYALLRDLFSFRFQILESDNTATVREKMEAGVAGFLGAGAELKAHFIGQLLGFDFSASPHLQGVLEDAKHIHSRAFAYLVEFFLAAAALQPVAIFLEDIHWADNKSLDLVNDLVRTRPDLQLLVVALTRPTLYERRPDWGVSTGSTPTVFSQLDLRPLSKWDSYRLVEEILRKADVVPPELRDMIVNSADGNPFFVEELIKMMIDDRVIIPGEDRWHIDTSRVGDVRVPPTLTGVLQARLDGLPPVERAALQQASVVGRIFWDEAVQSLWEKAENVEGLGGEGRDTRQALSALQARELIFAREKSAFAGTNEYIFKHAILRDVTYESVLKRLRRIYHAQVATWLIEHSGDRLNEYTSLIAEHYEQAGDLAKAADYLSRAGEQAIQISAYREARAFFERALALAKMADVPATLRVTLTRQLGEVHSHLSEYALARERYLASLQMARDANDRQGVAEALQRLGSAAIAVGEYDEAKKRLEESLALARQLDDRKLIAAALQSLGSVAWRRGVREEARALYQEALTIQREINNPRGIASSLHSLGSIATDYGEYGEAIKYYEESLAIYRRLGNRDGVSGGLNALGNVASSVRDDVKAKAYYEESLAIARDIGDRMATAIALSNIGEIEARQGEHAQARERYLGSLALCREMGNRFGVAYCLGNLGEVASDLGHYAEAAGYLREALGQAMELEATPLVMRVLFLSAKLLAKTGKNEQAVELLSQVAHHPASESEVKERALPMLEELNATLPFGVFSMAVERGKARVLEESVGKLLSAE